MATIFFLQNGGDIVDLTGNTEILYPITPRFDTNVIAHRADNKGWNVGQKTDDSVVSVQRATIELFTRMSPVNFGKVEAFFQRNYNVDFLITVRGVDLFETGTIGGTETVRLLGYKNPKRDDVAFYRLDIQLLKV